MGFTSADLDDELIRLQVSEDAILLWPANEVVVQDYGPTMFGRELEKSSPLRFTSWCDRPVSAAERSDIAKVDSGFAKDLYSVPVLDWPIRLDRTGQRHMDVFDNLVTELGIESQRISLRDWRSRERDAIRRAVDLRRSLGQGALELEGLLHWSM